MTRLQDLPLRATFVVEPDGCVWMQWPPPPPPKPKREPIRRRAEPFAKKCCGTGYGKPHAEGCSGWWRAT